MSGKAGTVRFGSNPDIHPDKASADGISKMDTQIGDKWTEIHFAYNPSQKSRSMSSTRGGDPGKDNENEIRQADYMSNHDGYLGGSNILSNLDERKVLNDTIYAINCKWADPGYDETDPAGWAPRQTVGAFD